MIALWVRRARSVAMGAASAMAVWLAVAAPVSGHGETPDVAPSAGSLLLGWTFEPLPTLGVAVALGWWWWAVRRVDAAHPANPVPRRRSVAFGLGMVAVAVALLSGIDRYDTTLFSVHMVQHLLLAMVAAPLIALGAPITLVLRVSSPATRRRWVLPVLHSRVVRVLAFPVVAWVLFAGVMWVAHFSALFDAALEDPLLHDLEHALFLGTGLLFWWPAVALDPAPWRMPHPLRALYVFLQMPQNTFLAVVILGASAPLYPHYVTLARSWGPTPLEDQQTAAGIMWLAGDVIFLIAILAILAGWMRAEARDASARGRRAGRHPRPREPARRTAGARARRDSGRECRLEVAPIVGGVHVPATDDPHDRSAADDPELVAPEGHRRDDERTGRFGHESSPFRGEPDADRDLGLGDRHHRVQVRPQVREGPSAEGLGPRAVGDGAGHVRSRPAHDLPARKRVAGIGREFRLDADDAGGRTECLERRGDPGGEPPSADGDQDGPDIGQVLGDLEADGPLSGDDPVVVVGRDDGQAALGRDRLSARLALLGCRAHHHDLGAVGGDPVALDGRRIAGHDDHGRRPEQSGGAGDALGVVPGRVGDDAAPPLFVGERGDRHVRAADLEGSDGLQALGLQEPSRLRASVRHERGPQGDPPEAIGGCPDGVEGDEVGPLGGRGHRRSWSIALWHSMQ
jgi:cytochrome c oxidase assembly factor CtaG